jgi:hypothetical protein
MGKRKRGERKRPAPIVLLMPRTARASQGGCCYHALNRGNARLFLLRQLRALKRAEESGTFRTAEIKSIPGKLMIESTPRHFHGYSFVQFFAGCHSPAATSRFQAIGGAEEPRFPRPEVPCQGVDPARLAQTAESNKCPLIPWQWSGRRIGSTSRPTPSGRRYRRQRSSAVRVGLVLPEGSCTGETGRGPVGADKGLVGLDGDGGAAEGVAGALSTGLSPTLASARLVGGTAEG